MAVKRRRFYRLGATFVTMLSLSSGRAQERAAPLFRESTFEELANIVVTTASRHDELASRVSAAVTVVTSDDIQRSGATNIPEALRYVPGLEVAQINAHDWAVSARGFNSRFANKQLVLEDGRTIYSPFSGGVYWEAVGPPLAEIEQIEIIRGPGATSWGANAMNGVINIVTKSARDTQGGVVSVGGGTPERETAYAGYGFKWGAQTWARVFVEGNKVGPAALANGSSAGDAGGAVRAGIRVDTDLPNASQLFFQAELSSARLNDSGDYPSLTAPYRRKIVDPSHMFEVHALTRWTRETAPDAKLTLQGFWSREERTQFRNDFSSETFDLELTHQFAMSDHQALVWGVGGRLITHELQAKVGLIFPDPQPTDKVLNIFAQDEIQLLPKRLVLTLGTKVEHNNITEVEVEPSVRLAWRPTDSQTVWAAISRSVHTPSVLERDIRYDAAVRNPPLTIVRQISEGNTESEVQIAYELGYRFQPTKQLSWDASVFYNDLPKVQAFRQGTPFAESDPAPAHFVLPLFFDKTGLQGESYGFELTVQWQATGEAKRGHVLILDKMPLGNSDPRAVQDAQKPHRINRPNLRPQRQRVVPEAS